MPKKNRNVKPDDLSNIFQATNLKEVYNLGDMTPDDSSRVLNSLSKKRHRSNSRTDRPTHKKKRKEIVRIDTSNLSVGNSVVATYLRKQRRDADETLEDAVHLAVAQRLRAIADEDNVHAEMAQTLRSVADAEEDNVHAGMAKKLRETVDKKSHQKK